MESVNEKYSKLSYNNDLETLRSELFDNLIDEKKYDLTKTINHIFKRIEQVCILLGHDFFNEVEAARFLRLPDPENSGKEVIRNYALRHKKLTFHKVGRNGLIFQRKDLMDFMETQKSSETLSPKFL